jgi:hypothetical protein
MRVAELLLLLRGHAVLIERIEILIEEKVGVFDFIPIGWLGWRLRPIS